MPAACPMKQQTEATTDNRNGRERSRSNGIRGACLGNSRRIKTTNPAAAAVSEAAESETADGAHSAASTKAPKVPAFSPALTASTRRAEPLIRGRNCPSSSAKAPSGRLIANSQGQDQADRMTAPIAGPAAEDSATVVALQPIAAPSRACGTIGRKRATPKDITAAPPRP